MKGNQPKLLENCLKAVQNSTVLDVFHSEEKNRGRLERRHLELFEVEDAPWNGEWKGLCRLIRLQRSGVRDGKEYSEQCLFISSFPSSSAAFFAMGIRGHWGIENRLHWVKDVIQNEDGAGINHGQAAQNLSIFKSMAIAIFRKNGFFSIKSASRIFANKVNELFSAVSGEQFSFF